MDPDHPSEALLPTFDHDRVSVVLVPSVDPAGTSRIGWAAGAAIAAVGIGMGIVIGLESAITGLTIGSLLAGTGAIVGLAVGVSARRIHVTLGATTLTIVRMLRGRKLHTRTVPLRSIRTAHAVDTVQGQGQTHRGLRLALEDGQELFLGAASVPVASLDWLAAEIRAVASRARSEPVGEVAPELVDLVSEDSRRRIEAARRAHATRQTG